MIPVALVAAALLVYVLGFAMGSRHERARYRETIRSLGRKGYIDLTTRGRDAA